MFPHHEEPPQGGVSNGDFAQDEVGWRRKARLTLSEVEVSGPNLSVLSA
jgi:hypothetical protein